MTKSISGRAVRMFRCQIPPLGLGPRPNNAHMPKDYGGEAVVDDASSGVIVALPGRGDHFIPFTNIQHIELYPLEIEETKKAKVKAV